MKKALKITLLLAAFVCLSCTAFAKKSQPNFIFILVDDLGKEWVQTYGAQSIETPHLDALAEQSLKFNNAYSMPQCTPSRVALMTGQYPYTNGWINHYDVPRWGHGAKYDPSNNPSIANALKAAGYKTCATGKWQINDFRSEPEAMVSAGFDEYCMWTGYESENPVSAERYWNPYIHTKEGSKTYEGQFGPDIFCDFVIDFMKENQKDPMFIYYPMVLTHTPFVHTPLHPNAETKFEKHKAMVHYTDFIINKIVTAVKDLGLDDNTYFVFTTDNGTVGSVIGKRNDVYVQGGKTYLTENGINAPFIVSCPNGKSGEVDALIDFTDIYPTFCDLAGAKTQKGYELNGKSFADVLLGKSDHSKRDWIMAMGSQQAMIDENDRVVNCFEYRDRAFRDEKFKVYVDVNREIVRIFDLENDPYETQNLIDDKSITDVLVKYKAIVAEMPSQDNSPKYQKLSSSPYNIPLDELNSKAIRDSKRKSNMKPLSTEEKYLKFVNGQK